MPCGYSWLHYVQGVTADESKEQRQRLWGGVVVGAPGCLLVALWARQGGEWILALGAILLGTAASQWFAWALLAMSGRKKRTGDDTQRGDTGARRLASRTVTILAGPVGLFLTGVVLYLGGRVTNNDRASGTGLGIAIGGALVFAVLLVVHRKRP